MRECSRNMLGGGSGATSDCKGTGNFHRANYSSGFISCYNELLTKFNIELL